MTAERKHAVLLAATLLWPLSVQEVVRMNAATFTASAKAKEA
jgi:hypothetical protein